ncbi:hypothetical protein DUNSADRAFT_3966, partial [Dunaliella salina]
FVLFSNCQTLFDWRGLLEAVEELQNTAQQAARRPWMSSSDDPGNWKDEDTQSESWGLDHSTALAILGACVVGFALLILVALLVFSCVVDRRKAKKQQDEEQQQQLQQQDPFATAQFSAKNAAFQASHKQELAAPMSMGESAGGASTYGGYGTQDGMPGGVAEQYAPPVGKWVGGGDPYAGYGSQGAMQESYAQPYGMPQYEGRWYQQQQQQQEAAPRGYLYDTEQVSMGWPQQPYEAPPAAGVKTTGAWS